MDEHFLERTKLLLGESVMKQLASIKVILFGIGGVGSWCAESLIRSGVHHLTLVDMDKVDETNINRQLLATRDTIGEIKVEVLKNRLLAINPKAKITPIYQRYTLQNNNDFNLPSYDYIIDAIDSIEDKFNLLIQSANKTDAVVFSSMGAALKINPLLIKSTEFWKVSGCPLAASLRRKFRKEKISLKKSIQCVYSDEKIIPTEGVSFSYLEGERRINGTLAHITAIFGFHLAGLLIQDIVNKSQ